MAAPSFAEWSQGGQQPAASPSFAEFSQQSAAPSFADYTKSAQAPTAGGNSPKLGGIWAYKGRTTFDPSALQSDDPAIQELIANGTLKKVETRAAQHGQNEGGEFDLPAEYSYEIDYDKLPKTQYGSLLDVWQADRPGGFKLKNPNAVVEDPNYGKIAYSNNYIDPSSQRNAYDLIGPLAMSAVFGLAGMGAFGALGAGQGTGLSLGRAAQGFLTSGGRNWSGIAGAAGNLTGIPGAGTAASYLASRAQGKDPGLMGLAPGAVSFAQWATSHG